MQRSEEGRMSFLQPANELTPTQNFEPTFHDMGQFYWGNRTAWLSNAPIHSGGLGLTVPSWRFIDIDTPDDWRRAEILSMTLEQLRVKP